LRRIQFNLQLTLRDGRSANELIAGATGSIAGLAGFVLPLGVFNLIFSNNARPSRPASQWKFINDQTIRLLC
jgi:hypothetical protein